MCELRCQRAHTLTYIRTYLLKGVRAYEHAHKIVCVHTCANTHLHACVRNTMPEYVGAYKRARECVSADKYVPVRARIYVHTNASACVHALECMRNSHSMAYVLIGIYTQIHTYTHVCKY